MIGNNWDNKLDYIFNSNEFKIFFNNIKEDYKKYNIFPEFENIFKAFKLTDYDDVKVIILGQDPYYKKDQADGLAFSINPKLKITPSLRNIFKEIEDDVNITNTYTDLTKWARQGVFLLNSSLTVKENSPASYSKSYWSYFTDEVIKILSNKGNLIFILWGNDAIKKSKFIDEDKNYILSSSHPSPLAAYRGFLGCKHFSKINKILSDNDMCEIDWSTL